jgi:HK97 family phage portal protein
VSRLAAAALALRQMSTNLLRATDGRDVLLNSPDGWEVEQPWLWWTGPSGIGSGGGPFGNPIPGAGSPATTSGSIPAVARATGIIVDTLATLPWHVYRDDVYRLPTPDWLSDPQALRLDGRVVNPANLHETRVSAVDFWGQWLVSALWFGDGFVWVPSRDASGQPRPPLYVLHPADVALKDGSYWVGDVQLSAGEIMHLRGQQPIVAGRGMGVLDRFAVELGLATSLRSYMSGAFTAGVPDGYLKTTTPNITQEQADSLKARWMAQHGTGRRSIAVLNASTEFHPLTWSPMDVAAAEFAKITLGQIELMFGLPAGFLGGPVGGSLTYSTVELRMLELAQLTLLPWTGRIEAVLDAQLPRGTEVRVEIDGLLRADTKTRYETYAIGIPLGIITADEARRLESRPPLAPLEGVV